MSATAASWFHCSVKPIGRASGRSVVAAAAYRFGVRLEDEQTKLIHDFRRRSGVEATFLVTPENAPAWSQDLQALWNAAQEADTRKNSRLARECELALPDSVSAEAREQIARDFAEHLVERYGVAVAVALHMPGRRGDQRNYHAHILFTTRRMEGDGLGPKTRELDARDTGGQEIQHLREVACELINQALADAGSSERVDHRSFKERGIQQEPQQHLGVEASAMESKGQKSRIGDHNREVKAKNKNTERLREEKAALDAAIELEIQEDDASSWEEQKRREQSFSGTAPGNADPSIPGALASESEEARKYKAKSAFNDKLNQEFIEEIVEHGSIKEYGLAGKGFEFSTAFLSEFMYNKAQRLNQIVSHVAAKAKGFWQRYISRDKHAPEREPEDRDHGFER